MKVKEGGKTGLTAVTTGFMFFIFVFFFPIFASIPFWATRSALVIVGSLMIREWVLFLQATIYDVRICLSRDSKVLLKLTGTTLATPLPPSSLSSSFPLPTSLSSLSYRSFFQLTLSFEQHRIWSHRRCHFIHLAQWNFLLPSQDFRRKDRS